jgi:hypothetical protein
VVDDEYPWYVRCYYAHDVEPPKYPGGLAIETKHKTEISMRMEIQAAEDRDDIDVVEYGRRHRLI